MLAEATKLETLKRAKKIGQEAGLEYIYLGNVPVLGDTYFPDCNTLLIDRTGYTVTSNLLKEGHCPNCNREVEGIWKVFCSAPMHHKVDFLSTYCAFVLIVYLILNKN